MWSPTAEDIRLLVRLVRRDAPGVERLLGTGRASIERLAGDGGLQGIAVVLLDALEALAMRDRLSDGALRRLEERRYRQQARSSVLLRALEDAAVRFAEAALPVVLLKGPYLADRFYGRLGAREFGDLDLLVPASVANGSTKAFTMVMCESRYPSSRRCVSTHSSVTVVPAPGVDSIVKRPPSAVARSCMPVSPSASVLRA